MRVFHLVPFSNAFLSSWRPLEMFPFLSGDEEGGDEEAPEGAAAAAVEAALRRLRHRHQQEVRHGHHGNHPRQHGEQKLLR